MTGVQQEDLGILALAALRHSMGRENGTGSVTTCSAIAHMVPLMNESDIRILIYEVETALAKYGTARHEWVELLTTLRRLDTP